MDQRRVGVSSHPAQIKRDALILVGDDQDEIFPKTIGRRLRGTTKGRLLSTSRVNFLSRAVQRPEIELAFLKGEQNERISGRARFA